ncbi:hypothetical protein B5E53_00710 [Eubacterium sp. An11]|uniref:RNA polymerase sigma factor n=1 Tax=Eubacterium sp. An11 TaxID=1965542 RepID=UPI000B3A7F7C|nr:RNA polymerase sigma factor [Eubacterium sp. An11]OUQ70176.1 hypothetical protein B5E53_00710 [Eubacterium sp. An11]
MINYIQLLDTAEERDFFVSLYEMYSQPLYRAALAILKDSAAAEDMVQETFLTLIDHIDRVTHRNPVKTWNYLLTILRHLCFDARNEKSPELPSNMETDHARTASDADIENDYMKQELGALLRDLILEMDYPYQDVIFLQYFHNMNSREIGDALHLKPENVRQIARRAREQLRKKLTERGYV